MNPSAPRKVDFDIASFKLFGRKPAKSDIDDVIATVIVSSLGVTDQVTILFKSDKASLRPPDFNAPNQATIEMFKSQLDSLIYMLDNFCCKAYVEEQTDDSIGSYAGILNYPSLSTIPVIANPAPGPDLRIGSYYLAIYGHVIGDQTNPAIGILTLLFRDNSATNVYIRMMTEKVKSLPSVVGNISPKQVLPIIQLIDRYPKTKFSNPGGKQGINISVEASETISP